MQEDQFDVTVAIVYADISGSTALYEKVGNTRLAPRLPPVSICRARG